MPVSEPLSLTTVIGTTGLHKTPLIAALTIGIKQTHTTVGFDEVEVKVGASDREACIGQDHEDEDVATPQISIRIDR